MKCKNMWRIIFSFIIAISIFGCSWITRFAVSNKSDDPITVIYSMAPYEHQKTKERICAIEKWFLPEITKDNLWRFNTGNWNDLSNENYILNSEECSVELTLNPGESVRVATKGTYTGHEGRYGKKSLDLTYLIIRTKDGEIVLKGWELLKRFKKVTDTLYVYSHE